MELSDNVTVLKGIGEKKAKLLEYIKDIGSSRAKLIAFTQYMEALVAYHRFYIGGKEG